MQFKKNQKDNNKNIAEIKKTVYVFIDASNIWQAQKAKGKFFDYDKLKIFLKNKFKALEINMFYYTAYPAQGTREYSLDGRHKFFTYLKNGGKKVYVFSSKNNVSQELRTGGDGYFDVLELTEDIWGQELRHRKDKA